MTGFIYFFLPECKNIPVEKMEKIWEEHTFCQDMRRDIQEIFKMTPHDKQVMMFSATLSKEIRPVCKKFMQDPMEIYMDDETKLTLHGLVQNYIKLTELEKNRKLNDLLDALDFNQVVIFVKSVNRVAELNKLLVECNFPSICTGTSQEERLTSYKGFKEGHKRILVATDLLGRGIDIERVNIVINYDMLDSADTYLHRVQERFEVDIKELPEQSDTSTYSKRVNLSSTGSPILCYDWILPGGKQQNLGIRVGKGCKGQNLVQFSPGVKESNSHLESKSQVYQPFVFVKGTQFVEDECIQ